MNKKWCRTVGLTLAFTVWTILVCYVDVASIGPNGSAVGVAAVNGWFHRLTGVNMTLYTVTDWLGLVPVAVCFGFALLGLCQWVHRRTVCKVDGDILLLGGFYLVTIAAYLLFESVVINYRPVLIAGYLEASYPSSTTLLTLCVMSTTWWQLCHRMRCGAFRFAVLSILVLFTAFMVVGRLISGVHWLTDVVGGVLLSGALVSLYTTLCHSVKK